MVSIRKFQIIVLVSYRIEYWSNYSIGNFEYSHSTNENEDYSRLYDVTFAMCY